MDYCISHYEKIFAAGGFYDGWEEDAFIQLEGSGYLTTVFEASHYKRGPINTSSADKTFLDEVHRVFTSIEDIKYISPTSIAVSLTECKIHDSVIYPNHGKSGIYYPTHRANDRPYVKLISGDTSKAKPTLNIKDEDRRIFYMGSAGSFNYGHWLIDDLARVKFLKDDPKPTTIVLQSHAGVDDVRLETLKHYTQGLDIRFMFMRSDDILFCPELTYVTPVSHHPVVKNAHALSFLREARPQSAQNGPKRLFVKRRAQRGRRLLNTDQVEKLMIGAGFTCIDPEDLNFQEQVTAFASAEVIVGTMCAAMCNTLFTPPDAKLIYLAPDGWIEPFYWDLAGAIGHDYTAIHGTRAMANSLPHLDDFTINIDGLRRCISLLNTVDAQY